MNLAELRDKLLAAARHDRPGEEVPYAFEKRVLAQMRAWKGEDPWLLWGRGLWRAAAACVLISILLGAWSVWPAGENPEATLEATVFSAAEALDDSW